MIDRPDLYRQRNEAIRLVCLDKIEGFEEPLQVFFRRIGLPHVYSEVLVPAARQGNSLIFAGVRDRPWPPWGLGAQKIHAVAVAHPLGEASAGLSNVFALDEDLVNVGMISALYQEALRQLIQRGKAHLNYAVAEGSVLGHHVLSAAGFRKTEELFLTEHARYHFYRASTAEHLDRLGLAQASPMDLLTHRVEPAVLERNALFHATLQLATAVFWRESVLIAEIIALLGGIISTLPPGGPPPPGTSGPSEEGGGVGPVE